MTFSRIGEPTFDVFGVDVVVEVSVADDESRRGGSMFSGDSSGLVGIRGVDTGVVGDSGGSFSISG